MDYSQLEAMLKHGSPMPTTAGQTTRHRRQLADAEDRWAAEWGSDTTGAGEPDEGVTAHASDLSDLDDPALLAKLPNPPGVQREHDADHMALSSPVETRDGKTVNLGTELYGEGWDNPEAPTPYELQERQRDATEVIHATASLPREARNATRLAALRERQFEAEYGSHDPEHVKAACMHVMRRGISMADEGFCAAVSDVVRHIEAGSAPADEGNPRTGEARHETHRSSGDPDAANDFISQLQDAQRRMNLF